MMSAATLCGAMVVLRIEMYWIHRKMEVCHDWLTF